MCPIISKYKPFIVHLVTAKTGNANSAIDDILKKIKEKSQSTNFPVKYISMDGDSHYSPFFREQFDKLFQLYLENDLDGFNKQFDEILPILISDPLHIWKNLRTRLFLDIVINPFVDANSINATKLNSILDLGPILSDKSQVAKMRDEFAIGLFNFKNSLELFNKYTRESFVYIFIVALWVESLLNVHLSPESRVYLINILLRILSKIYQTFKEKQLPSSVSFKKSTHNNFITICTIEKIERMFPTLLATRYEICKHKHNRKIGLGRLGTHCAENKIGNIRSQSKQDERVENLVHVASRYDFIRSLTKSNDDPRKKRLNQGGVRLEMGNVDISQKIPFETIADFILYKSGYMNKFDEKIMNDEIFNQFLSNVIEIAPYDPKISYTSTKNHKIVDRYYSLPEKHDYHVIYERNHAYTAEEIRIIDTCLMHGQEKNIQFILKYIPERSLTKFVGRRKTELADRPLTKNEVDIINSLLWKNLNYNEIASVLQCRTGPSIKRWLFGSCYK